MGCICRWNPWVASRLQYKAALRLLLSPFASWWTSNALKCYAAPVKSSWFINTLRPRQNGRHFADDTFKPIFLNENIRISIKISLKFVPKVPINSFLALVQIMAWHRPGDKPLSEPMMVCLLTHICVTRPQWVNRTCLSEHRKHRSQQQLAKSIKFCTPMSKNWYNSKSNVKFCLHIWNWLLLLSVTHIEASK